MTLEDRVCSPAWILFAVVLVLFPAPGITEEQLHDLRPSVDELVTWLDQRETEWVATAHLQRLPEAAIPLLLQSGRAKVGPHGDWTPALLTLAKIGEPAVPAILDRLESMRKEPSAVNWQALVKVLAATGPPAIPALVQVGDIAPWALEAIVNMEPPPTTYFGQNLEPWMYWRPADDRLSEIQRAVVPLLPRIRAHLDDALREWTPKSSPWHLPAAYLIARWGTGEMRARGREALEDVATSSRSYYPGIDSIRLLHRLRDPRTAELHD